MGDSIFEDPDFFERVVLGVNASPGPAGEVRLPGSEVNAASDEAERELREIQLRLEQQRLARHASQISAELRRRRDAIERRRESWERRDAELEQRERAARVWIDQRLSELLEREQQLSAFEAELQSRAAGLAAWELQLQSTTDKQTARAHRLDQAQQLQASALNQQARQLAARETRLEREASEGVGLVDTGNLAKSSNLKLGAAQEVAPQTSSDSTPLSNPRQEVDERVEQLIQWECELSRLFASDDQETSPSCIDERGARSESLESNELMPATQETATPIGAGVGPLPFVAASGSPPSGSEAERLSRSDLAAQSVQRAAQLEQLLEKWEKLVLAALEDRVVTQEVHRHLCESCDPQTIAELEISFRDRVRPLIEAALELVDQQRQELSHWLSQRTEQFRAWTRDQEQLWLTRERRWKQLRQRWLGFDSHSEGLSGPHATRSNLGNKANASRRRAS